MLAAGAVDVQQADVTRCGGITELLRVDALCRAHCRPLSLHCGPAPPPAPRAGAVAGSCISSTSTTTSRIERMLFDGVAQPHAGALRPDLTTPGMGLEFKRQDAERLAA